MSLNSPESPTPHDATTARPAQLENQVAEQIISHESTPDALTPPSPPPVDDLANDVTTMAQAPGPPVKMRIIKIIKDGEVVAEHESDFIDDGALVEQLLKDRLVPPNKPLPDKPLSMMVGLTCTHCGSPDSVRFPAAYEWSKGADLASYLLLNQRTAIKKILHDKPGTDKELLELTTPPEEPDKPSSTLIIFAGIAGVLRFVTALYATLNGNPRYFAIFLGLIISILNAVYYFSSKKEYQKTLANYNEKYQLWWQQWLCGQCKRVFREYWPEGQSSN